MKKRIPVTVITGFLGSGKTTLLRYLLKNTQLKLAVIINEFGEVGIDGDLIRSCGFCSEEESEERIVELKNGCLCCTVQEDFLPTMEMLLSKSNDLDGIVVETSGLALPRPLLQALQWPEIRSHLYIDGVVTMVDAEALSLGSPVGDILALEAQRANDESIDHLTPVNELFDDQLQSADLVLLSRSDLISKKDLSKLKLNIHKKVREGTCVVPLIEGRIDSSLLLGLKEDQTITSEELVIKPEEHSHSHMDVNSEYIQLETLLNRKQVEEVLVSLAYKYQVLRLKGRFWIKNKSIPLQIQMVGPRINSWFESSPDNVWKPKGNGLDLVAFSLRSGLKDHLISVIQKQ